MNKALLKEVVKKATGSSQVVDELSTTLGISKKSVCDKQNGKRLWSSAEIETCRVKYNICDSDVVRIFVEGYGREQ